MENSGRKDWKTTFLVSEASQKVEDIVLEQGSEHELTCLRNPDKGTFGDFFIVTEIDGLPVQSVGMKVSTHRTAKALRRSTDTSARLKARHIPRRRMRLVLSGRKARILPQCSRRESQV